MPPFSGWYTDLFFGITDETWSFDPTIADVHTDPNAGQVLHVGTGEANLLVLTANTSCGVKAYAGPTSSYYEVIMSGFVRLTDEEWQTQFGDGKDPEPPLWTADFLVK
jgi:hypothetical protein